MRYRGMSSWYAVDACLHTLPSTLDLAQKLGLDLDTTVGKLCRLYSWAKLAGLEDGNLGYMPPEELAGICRWHSKPEILLAALLSSGLLARTEDSGYTICGWYALNGHFNAEARKAAQRKAESRRKKAPPSSEEG